MDRPAAPHQGPGLSGRKAEAARNDQAILDAARSVFIRDPAAPISAVAEEAGVGVGALYRRYASKEELLRTLCADGLRRFIAIAEHALSDEVEAAESFAVFLGAIIDADVHSLTVRLAGTFTPTGDLRALAGQANTLAERVFRRARHAGALRGDLRVNDIALLLEQITAVRVDDPERTTALRRRYVALLLDALRPAAVTGRLPGPPPTSDELGVRWRPAAGEGAGRS